MKRRSFFKWAGGLVAGMFAVKPMKAEPPTPAWLKDPGSFPGLTNTTCKEPEVELGTILRVTDDMKQEPLFTYQIAFYGGPEDRAKEAALRFDLFRSIGRRIHMERWTSYHARIHRWDGPDEQVNGVVVEIRYERLMT